MKYIKKLIRNSKRALNQQVIKKKQEIVKYAPRLTGIQEQSNHSGCFVVFGLVLNRYAVKFFENLSCHGI